MRPPQGTLQLLDAFALLFFGGCGCALPIQSSPDFRLSFLYTDIYKLQICCQPTGLAKSLKRRAGLPFLERLPKAGQAQDCSWLKAGNLQKTGIGGWTAFSRAEANDEFTPSGRAKYCRVV